LYPADFSVFLGPTSVGKTEPACAPTDSIFDSEEKIMRNLPLGICHLNSSGAWSVVLCDEIEKAHPDLPAPPHSRQASSRSPAKSSTTDD
jgi:hypothetical protein